MFIHSVPCNDIQLFVAIYNQQNRSELRGHSLKRPRFSGGGDMHAVHPAIKKKRRLDASGKLLYSLFNFYSRSY